MHESQPWGLRGCTYCQPWGLCVLSALAVCMVAVCIVSLGGCVYCQPWLCVWWLGVLSALVAVCIVSALVAVDSRPRWLVTCGSFQSSVERLLVGYGQASVALAYHCLS